MLPFAAPAACFFPLKEPFGLRRDDLPPKPARRNRQSKNKLIVKKN